MGTTRRIASRLLSSAFLLLAGNFALSSSVIADEFAPGYDLIRDDGTDENRRGALNLTGAGVSCADDSANNETECDISGGGSGNSFETINAPAGTAPVAESSTDTLNLTSADGTVTVTGTAGTDTLDFSAVDLTCTDCIGVTEIADSYVLNTGDTMTGSLSLALASGSVTITPTSGVAAGMHAELWGASDTLFSLKNGARWLIEEWPDKFILGGNSTTASSKQIILKTDGTGDGEVELPANSISGGEVITALSDRSAGFICPAGLSTDEDCEEIRHRIPFTCTVQRVDLTVTTAPTGAALIVDFNECDSNGVNCVSIDSGTKPQIAAGATSGSDTAFTDTILTAGNKVGMDIDQVGSTVAGSDFTGSLECRF